MTFLRKQGFILCLFGACLLGALIPQVGSHDSPLQTRLLTQVGVFIIFLNMGLSLPLETLLQGFMQWRQHVFTQVWIFLGLPLLGIGLNLVLGPFLEPPMRQGLLFLAILPTTVSSAVAFTTLANGKVAVALFNTTLSNLAGVLLVPFMAYHLIGPVSEVPFSFSDTFRKLALIILLPLVIGLFLHRPAKPLLPKLKPLFKPLNSGIIIFIVFVAISNAFANRIWDAYGWQVAVQAAWISWLLLGTASCLVWFSSRLLEKDRPARLTLFFCASQKTLAAGAPLAMAIYGNDPKMGLLLLPLIIYHPSQLVLGALLLNRKS